MSGISLTNLKNRLKAGSVAMFFLAANLGAAAVPFLPAQVAEAAPVCVNDTAGANDQPGQKDLTKLCVDYAGSPTTVSTTFNWDETGTSGANTMDACNLFDTDGDGNINYAVCVTTTNDPAVLQTTTTYSCGDAKIDRCTAPATIISSGTTTCAVSQQNTDPFPTGSSSPKDTQGVCIIQLSTVGGSTARLIDVCSYPSAQPNSDPSDCVIIRNSAGKVEVIKDLIPATNSGLFNLSIDGPQTGDTTTVNNVGDGGTTGEVVVKDGTVIVSETAGTSTALGSYSTSIVCRNLNGTGAIVAQSTPTGASSRQLQFTLADQADVVCTITNTAAGSITIVKDAVPNSTQVFSFTGTGTGVTPNFTLEDDGDETDGAKRDVTFNNLGAGTYSFGETVPAGWDMTSSCSDGSTINNVQLSAGENITCTFTNTKRGNLIVRKTTNPVADPTSFTISASGNGTITGGGAGSVTDANDQSYEVTPGTYSVSETVPSGWSKTGDTCQSVVVAAGQTVYCDLTNTKLGSLTIIKDALPNDAQDFSFGVTGLAGGAFSLDDDADPTLVNTKVYSDLLPGQYSVAENSTPGWALTSLVCGNDAIVGATANVNLTAGQNVTCTFTNTKLGSIAGIKYTSDADSSLGPVLSGWTIYIDSNNNGLLDEGESSDVTDANGGYSFTDLLPDTYVLLEVLQAGWTQIFGPDPVTLAAGEASTENDFGNFQNGSIGGFKWNDKNANGVVNEGEEKLNGWTITLYNDGVDEDTNLDDVVGAPVVTAGQGAYSFANLAPGTYSVCETQQTNWVQTYPASNACHTIVIDQSGETNQANFGNQGRGSIQVVKNVDSDGDGDVDSQDVTDWTWDINSAGNFATGSGNPQNVAAGDYIISEDQKTDYHVTSSGCSGEDAPLQPTTSLGVTVGVGETVTCIFTNTRDTGTITVNKVVSPSDDSGKFNLLINGVTYAANVSDGGTTSSVQVPTGTYTASETAGTDTSLADYSSSYTCSNELTGNATTTSEFSVTSDQSVTCTFTNVRYGKIVVTKQTLPDGSQKEFGFNANYNEDGFNLSDGQSNNSGNLLPGTYSVSENIPKDWDLTSANCDDQSNPSSISLQAGETINCTFTNTQRGSISGTKYQVAANDTAGTEGNELEGWTIQIYNDNSDEDTALNNLVATDVTNADGNYRFSNLIPATYLICEVLQDTWTQIFPSGVSDCYTVVLNPGQNTSDKDFGNFKNGSISGYKFNDLNGNGIDNEEPRLEGWEITLYQNENKVDQTETNENGAYSFTNLQPGTYVVCETEQTGWQQITPVPTVNEGCYEITINVSGESNDAVFGNQGRGSIKVVKNVDMNNDGDVTDDGDIVGATDWSWSLGSAYYSDEEVATGTEKSNIPAGDYTISETQKTNYHFVSVSCGETKVTQAESFTIELTPGANIVCTFTNARDTAQIKVVKSLAPTNDEGRFNLLINDTAYATNVGDGGTTGWVTVPTGTYDVSETGAEGTDLDNYVSTNQCSWGRTSTSGEGTSVNDLVLSKDKEVTCTFYNERKAEVTVIKYNDINRNGLFDEGEETLPNWGFNLVSQTDCEPEYDDLYDFLSDDYDEELPCVQAYPDYAETQTTGEDGSTTFSNIVPNEDYVLTETQKEGWFLSNIDCDGGYNYEGYPVGDGYYITPNPGESITCVVGNYREANLLIDKQNDKTSAVRTGTTVTYTLIVSLPEDSGAVFDAVVRDILPAGFTYVPGSWTSTASETTDPLFDPIGEWQIGDLYPGDSVVLTYQATIDDSVSPGTYTNIAYSEACAIESRYHYDLGRVLDDYEGDYVEQEPYCKEVVTTDFVTSDVTVFEPKVLAASVTKTVLVNTGSGDAVRNALIGLSLVMMTIVLAMATRNQQKGTK